MVAIILEAFRGQCLFEMISGLYDPFILTRAVRAGYLSCMHQIGSTHAALVMLVGHCYLHYYLPCRAPFLKCKELWAEEISLKHITILDDHAVAVCLLWQSNSFLLSLSPILLWTEPVMPWYIYPKHLWPQIGWSNQSWRRSPRSGSREVGDPVLFSDQWEPASSVLPLQIPFHRHLHVA